MSKTLYYSDELNDDFSGTRITRRALETDYQYFNRGILGAVKKFIVYRLFLTPLSVVYCKLFKRVSYRNRRVFKGYKGGAAFIYGNHTAYTLDAFNPTLLSFPRAADVIVNSDAASIRGLRGIVRSGGALPIPEGYRAMVRFNGAVEEAVSRGHWIAVYPEAHIWPYCTRIRNFPSTSFAYPVKFGVPVFSFTMTYKKRRLSKLPKRAVYVDGPFFADKNLSAKAAAKKLRDEVYAAMCVRAKISDCSLVEYVYRPKGGD